MAKGNYGDQNGKNKPAGSKFSRLSEAVAGHKAQTQPDWGRIDDQLIFKLVQAATEEDGAIMFGYSRDGGAYSVKIYGGGDTQTFYEHEDEAITRIMTNIMEVLNG